MSINSFLCSILRYGFVLTLRIEEKDGAVIFNEIRKVTFGKAGAVIIYPNPAPGKTINVSLAASTAGKAVLISIITLDGKVVSKTNFAAANQTETLDVSNLSSGTYMVRVETKSEVINTMLQVIK